MERVKAIALGLLALGTGFAVGSNGGCTVYWNSSHVHHATQSTSCLLGMCESADEVDRVGDPSSAGDVNEVVEEANSIDQGQDGTLDAGT